jgi:hypothetical protein
MGLEGIPAPLWECLEEHAQGCTYLLALGRRLWELRTETTLR